MKKPRICIVVPCFFPWEGGAEKQAHAQCRALRERGYEVTVVTFRHEGTWPRRDVVDGVPVLRVAGWMLAGQPKRPAALRKLAYLAALADLGWTLWWQRGRYNILHVYKLNVLALFAAVVCRITGARLVVGVKSRGPSPAAGARMRAQLDAGPLPPTPLQGRMWAQTLQVGGDLEDLERIGPLGVRLTHALLRRIDATIILLSTSMESYLAEHNFELPNIQLIPNGVDTARFAPSPTDPFLDERAQVVVCVARLRWVKGIDILLRAWRLVHAQATKARLLIVGDGALKAQLQDLAMELGLAESVEFVGDQDDIPAQLHRGALGVLSSRFEGMPNALLEAMACGLSCVSTRVSGSEDLIQNGVNGLLVEPEDDQGLAEALLTLVRDLVLARRYGRAARATVEQHYSFDCIMDRYVDLYHRLLDGK
jgi:glycosyltransferase involved in cell wall biosynthesis